ncbi:hypothetical protein [Paenibacillus lautus]|uniref:hypothetical protein n=1 Tax=Paenibacillus lautus TaxID=1401 RepID=UPI003D9AACDD
MVKKLIPIVLLLMIATGCSSKSTISSLMEIVEKRSSGDDNYILVVKNVDANDLRQYEIIVDRNVWNLVDEKLIYLITYEPTRNNEAKLINIKRAQNE